MGKVQDQIDFSMNLIMEGIQKLNRQLDSEKASAKTKADKMKKLSYDADDSTDRENKRYNKSSDADKANAAMEEGADPRSKLGKIQHDDATAWIRKKNDEEAEKVGGHDKLRKIRSDKLKAKLKLGSTGVQKEGADPRSKLGKIQHDDATAWIRKKDKKNAEHAGGHDNLRKVRSAGQKIRAKTGDEAYKAWKKDGKTRDGNKVKFKESLNRADSNLSKIQHDDATAWIRKKDKKNAEHAGGHDNLRKVRGAGQKIRSKTGREAYDKWKKDGKTRDGNKVKFKTKVEESTEFTRIGSIRLRSEGADPRSKLGKIQHDQGTAWVRKKNDEEAEKVGGHDKLRQIRSDELKAKLKKYAPKKVNK